MQIGYVYIVVYNVIRRMRFFERFLLGRILMTLKVEEVSDALAHWYPPLLQMRLAVWHVSGITYKSEEFLQGHPAMCSSHGVQGQKRSIQRLGNVFVTGVI